MTRQLDEFTTTQTTNTYQDINSGMSESAYMGFLIAIAVIVVIGVVIFVLWIRSMLAMISLDEKFKAFYDEYSQNNDVYDKANSVEASGPYQTQVDEADKVDNEEQDDVEWWAKKPSSASIVILVALVIILIVTIVILF